MVLPEIDDDLALQIFTQSIVSMQALQSDQLFLTPSGTTIINTILFNNLLPENKLTSSTIFHLIKMCIL